MMKLAAFCLFTAALLPATSEPAKKNFWKGSSDGFAITWSSSNLVVTRSGSGKVVIDVAAHAKTEWRKVASQLGKQSAEAQYTYRLLSVLGPYLTVEESVYCDCGGAHPSERKRFESIDLANSSVESWKPGSVSLLFSEQQVRDALGGDSVVKKALGSAPPPGSLSNLLDALQDKTAKVKDCEFSFDSDLLQDFAVYDVQGGSAIIRLSLAPAAEVCRGQMTQLGLTLSVPDKNKDWFQGAQHHREGLLMIDASHLGKTASTTISFKH